MEEHDPRLPSARPWGPGIVTDRAEGSGPWGSRPLPVAGIVTGGLRWGQGTTAATRSGGRGRPPGPAPPLGHARRMEGTTRDALNRLVMAQLGLVTREQLLSYGVSRETIRWRLTSKRWAVVHPGVYLTSPGRRDWPMRAMAAVLHGGPGAVLWAHSAAFSHGLGREPDTVQVLVSHAVQIAGRPGVSVTRARDLAARTAPEVSDPDAPRPGPPAADHGGGDRPRRRCPAGRRRGAGSGRRGLPEGADLGRGPAGRAVPPLPLPVAPAARRRPGRRRCRGPVRPGAALPARRRACPRPAGRGVAATDGRRPPSSRTAATRTSACWWSCRDWRSTARRLPRCATAVGNGTACRRGGSPYRRSGRTWRTPCALAREVGALLARHGWSGRPRRCRRRGCAAAAQQRVAAVGS